MITFKNTEYLHISVYNDITVIVIFPTFYCCSIIGSFFIAAKFIIEKIQFMFHYFLILKSKALRKFYVKFSFLGGVSWLYRWDGLVNAF